MTDAEKELRRLEKEDQGLSPWRWSREVTPDAVLALLDRIEALENMLAKKELEAVLGPALDIIREPLLEMGSTFPGGGLLGIAEGIREVVAKAERKGAEEMRERAADEAWRIGAIDGVSSSNLGEIGAGIRRLSLPGDEAEKS